MRTTLDIDPKLLEQVATITGEKSPSKAVSRVLEDFVRRHKVKELLAIAGKVDIVDNWRELEEMELKEMQRTEKNEW